MWGIRSLVAGASTLTVSKWFGWSPLNVTVPLSPGASMLQHPDFPFVLEQSLLNICQLVRVTYLK